MAEIAQVPVATLKIAQPTHFWAQFATQANGVCDDGNDVTWDTEETGVTDYGTT